MTRQPGIFRRPLSAALASLLTLMILAPALAGETPDLASASPAAPVVTTTMVPVADSLRLATDVYRPGPEAAPVILIRTPYGRQGHDFLGAAFAARGYVVVLQDVRGKYDSDGEHEPFRHEESDGLATLKWISGQPWCNGKIGMWGISYSAYAGLVLADSDRKELASILAFSGWLEAGDIVYPGGAMHLMLDLPWMLTQQGGQQRSLGEFDMEALFRHVPVSQAMRAAGIVNSTWEDPDFLREAVQDRTLGPVRRPVLHATGWSDMVYEASLRAYQRLAARAEAPQKLILGPWFHDQMMMGEWQVGDADFGPASGFGVDELIALSVRWFDATLRGEKNGMLEEPPVTYFLMDQNAWHTAGTWPPTGPEIREQVWYLDSGGGAHTAGGDGVLSRDKPGGAPFDRFVYDPQNPVPTHGGANFHFFPERIGVRDQSAIEQRDDVLVYTSPPLEQEMQITGPLRARLHVATTGQDADFTAKLVVVRPDGYARIVEEGIARASAVLDPLPESGQAFALDVDMGQTALAVPAGHRLRLEISSSNFPKYDRNPSTGDDPFTAARLVGATQTVYHQPGQASFLTLPVRRQPLTLAAASREPLAQPLPPISGSTQVAVQGDDAGALLAQGRAHLEAGETDAAIAALERVVELRPQGSAEHYWLGRAYLQQLNSASTFKKLALSKKVRSSYLKALEQDPDNLEARSSLASFYFNAPAIAGGSESKGLAQVEEVRRRDPKAAHLLLAGHYAGKDKPARAAEEYRAALALDPDDADTLYRLGMLHQRSKEWDEAFAVFEKGVAATDDLRCLYQIGRTAVFSGQRLERARAALEEYIRRQPDPERLPSEAAARWRIGMTYEKESRPDLARRQYEAALRLEPDFEQAQESLEALGPPPAEAQSTARSGL